MTGKRVRFTADDFGLSEQVNEAVERACRDGVLTDASLMVAGDAVDDAVRRARAMPGLRVGLHLVVIEGRAVLPPATIPALVGADGRFPSDQLRLGMRYYARPDVRRQLRAEIEAQFDAFAGTGLTLAHADAHKHMHLHPTVGAMLLRSGQTRGLRRVRVPREPPDVVARCGTSATPGARALFAWARLFRAQARRAGMDSDDSVFGLAWSGHMTEARVLRLLANLPAGNSEIYFHPASASDPALSALMPGYEHGAELAALLSPAVRAAIPR